MAGDLNRFIATGADTDGTFAQWEVVVGPGGGPVPHSHSRENESIFVLEGQVTIHVGQDSVVATKGSYISLPRHVPHWFRNESAAEARLLFTIAPAGLERFFFECGREVPADQGLPSPPTAEERARIQNRASAYGLTIFHPTHRT